MVISKSLAVLVAACTFSIEISQAAPYCPSALGTETSAEGTTVAAAATNTVAANRVSTTGKAASKTSIAIRAASSVTALNATVLDCHLQIPDNALTADGLSTPWQLLPPCSQAVSTQQAFAEAAIIDSGGQISIYHPLIIDEGKTAQVAPIVPNVSAGSQLALYFGFNGNTLILVDTNGEDANSSPVLKQLQCVNGLPGTKGDVFGQVSWCNTEPFWNATNAAVASGELKVPDLGTNSKGGQCLSSHSFEIIDQDQSDNLPTKYLLLSDNSTVQFTAANQKKFSNALEIDNASDEALIADFVDPATGCTPFRVASIDDPGTMVSALATQELQALLYQKEPIAIVPLNDPDTLLTANSQQSTAKINAYRLGVNMPLLGTDNNTDNGSPTAYCSNMINVQPPFLAQFQTEFANSKTPDATVGNNLFTFLAHRFLMSVTNLKCSNKKTPVTCQIDGNMVATSCMITTTATGSTSNGTGTSTGITGTKGTGLASGTAKVSGIASSAASAKASATETTASGRDTPTTAAGGVSATKVVPAGAPKSSTASARGGGATTDPILAGKVAGTAGTATAPSTSVAAKAAVVTTVTSGRRGCSSNK